MSYCVEAAAKELSLEPEELREVLDLMVVEAAQNLREARKSLAGEEFEQYLRYIHTIKGAAGNLRMKDLAALALQAEKIRDASQAEQEALFLQIERELNDVIGDIVQVYSRR